MWPLQKREVFHFNIRACHAALSRNTLHCGFECRITHMTWLCYHGMLEKGTFVQLTLLLQTPAATTLSVPDVVVNMLDNLVTSDDLMQK